MWIRLQGTNKCLSSHTRSPSLLACCSFRFRQKSPSEDSCLQSKRYLLDSRLRPHRYVPLFMAQLNWILRAGKVSIWTRSLVLPQWLTLTGCLGVSQRPSLVWCLDMSQWPRLGGCLRGTTAAYLSCVLGGDTEAWLRWTISGATVPSLTRYT